MQKTKSIIEKASGRISKDISIHSEFRIKYNSGFFILFHDGNYKFINNGRHNSRIRHGGVHTIIQEDHYDYRPRISPDIISPHLDTHIIIHSWIFTL